MLETQNTNGDAIGFERPSSCILEPHSKNSRDTLQLNKTIYRVSTQILQKKMAGVTVLPMDDARVNREKVQRRCQFIWILF